jgi:serine/threonine protein kinase
MDLAMKPEVSLGAASGGSLEGLQLEPTRERLGPYRLCLKIASGGMATVYLARADANIGRNRFVALKVIHPHLANDRDFVQMFMDEAEIASRIHHTNVCTVYDYDVERGSYYIAMEHLIGRAMSSIWRKTTRRPPENLSRHAKLVARALADACEGLHAAHELTDAEGEPLDVVHRDISPENVFLTYDGIAKVVDFGIASAARKRHRTRTGIVKGKYAYVAPECLSSQTRPDRRTDIWGVGVIAWELLTGQRLFHRETDVETLHAVQDGKIAPPSEIRDELPPELDAIVMRALTVDPSERYETAREFGKALARFAGSGDEVVGSAELAEWMEELFPGGVEHSTRLLDVAGQIESTGGGSRSSTPGCACAAAQRGSAATITPPPPAPSDAPRAGDLSTEWMMPTTLWPPRSAPPPAPAQPRVSWWTAAALLAGLLVGAATVALVTHGSTEVHAAPITTIPEATGPDRPATVPATASRFVSRSSTATRLAGDGYVVEIDQGHDGELVLKVRPSKAKAEELPQRLAEEEPRRKRSKRTRKRATAPRPGVEGKASGETGIEFQPDGI